MNFQQLRSVRETARCGFNLTEVAAILHTSQPGVSRQIRELEEELGVEIFVRAGSEFQDSTRGALTIAATHSQARYALPPVVRDFRAMFPQVTLHLRQGSPRQVAEMLLSGEADLGVATEALTQYPQLVTLPCYRWTHSIVVPPGHPLLDLPEPVSLQQLARYPIITYDLGYTGRSHIDNAFAQAGLQPEVVLTAMDADVIKTYVELGMGVGIVASIALDPERDQQLRMRDARHLFEVNLTRLAIRRGNWLRGYVFAFIETFAPTLSREVVEAALAGDEGAA
ncbi:MAG: LysR substrate-binding domain-containing protein [Rhodoferax sp.]